MEWFLQGIKVSKSQLRQKSAAEYTESMDNMETAPTLNMLSHKVIWLGPSFIYSAHNNSKKKLLAEG